MPTFVYRAKKNSAETVSGQITAQNKDEAVDLISQLGFLPISVEPQTTKAIQPCRIKSKEIYIFSRQLANLLKSGVSILRALKIIEEQTQPVYFKHIISNVADQVKNGRSFSESLTLYPRIFSPLYITMIHAGEESGNLFDILTTLSIHQHRQEEIKSKVKTALVYPCLMALVGLGTILFILCFVLPKMSGLFSSLGNDLPWPTQMLLAVSHFLNKGWIFVIGILAAAVIGALKWIRSAKGKMVFSRIILRLPIFGDVLLKTELARFSSTLSLLMKSGVSIVRALQITIPVLNNNMLQHQFVRCKDFLVSGRSLGEGIGQVKQIPPMMGQLINLGEESGNLVEVLQEISDMYEQDVNEKVKMMTTLLEPIMILTVGLMVGFMVFAMLLPIFQIDSLVK